jgi:hypothetical protein
VNSPDTGKLDIDYLDSDLNFQFLLTVNEKTIFWLQLLVDIPYSEFIDIPYEISLTIYEGVETKQNFKPHLKWSKEMSF